MKLVVVLALISCMVAFSLAQMVGTTAQQQPQRQAPNFLQLMMMRNMFDMNWLPLMFLSGGMGGMGGSGGSGGMGGMGALPWLLMGGNM